MLQTLCDSDDDCKANPLWSSSPFLHWPTFCLQNVYCIRYICALTYNCHCMFGWVLWYHTHIRWDVFHCPLFDHNSYHISSHLLGPTKIENLLNFSTIESSFEQNFKRQVLFCSLVGMYDSWSFHVFPFAGMKLQIVHFDVSVCLKELNSPVDHVDGAYSLRAITG